MKLFGQLVKEFFTFIVLAVVIVLPIRIFIAQPFIVEGESMHPTFENGDYLIVDELTYRFEKPQRGDVITFRYPGDPSIFYIKRIIGLPGETVAINRGVVSITKPDGTTLTLTEPYIAAEDATYTKTTTLGPDQYFMMGDNRPNSSDSRVWGPLPENDIMGRVIFRLLPIPELGLFPGATTYAPVHATTSAAAPMP
ncbi:MAG: signal peptidase I [Patescibacteria group bacterium]|nr:signal peptidase I [Patescibacteria group bacterium]MDE1966261.1 signal peptidase I [Patescibacteria group bacterium]